MTEPSSERIHASCVSIDGSAVLLSGRSGSGKSDLALRLIDRGAALISDDYTLMARQGGHLFASAPDPIRGKIELYGVGIVEMPVQDSVRARLIVLLDEEPVRMPDTASRLIAGVEIPAIALSAFEASAPIKIEFALKAVLAR